MDILSFIAVTGYTVTIFALGYTSEKITPVDRNNRRVWKTSGYFFITD